MFTGRELNNPPLESAGLAGARRVDPLKVITSRISATQQERRCAYRRKRNARRGPPVVELRLFNQPPFCFTDCESFTSLSSTTSSSPIFFSQKVGVTHCRHNSSISQKFRVFRLNSPSISCSPHLPPKAILPSFTSIPKSYTNDTVVPSIPSTTPVRCSGSYCISHNSFSILSRKLNSDSDFDSNFDFDSDAADSIVLTNKMLLAHPQGIYRGD